MTVADSSAAFDGPYGENPRRRMVSRLTEMLMMRPQPTPLIAGTAARAIRNVPLTFVSTSSRHVSGEISQKRVGSVMNASFTYFMPRAALFTRMSRRPKRWMAASTRRSQSLACVTSARWGITLALASPSSASRATASISPRSRAAVART